MFSVKFDHPIVVSADKLGELLQLAGVPATISPFITEAPMTVPDAPAPVKAKPGRKPKAETAEAAPAAPTGKKRGRKSNAEKAAEAAALAAAAAAAAAAEAGSTPDAPASDAAPSEPDAPAASTETPPAADGAAAAAPAPVEPKPAKKSGGKKNGSEKKDAGAAAPEGMTSEILLQRFSALIDKDFEGAKSVLDGFGVNRFSDLKTEQHASFADKLSEMGV